jgi:hypothetical protein
MKIFRFFLLTTCSLLLFPIFTFAQGLPGISNPITIDVSPTNPGPGDTVTLTANSSSFDVNSALLTWTENGKVVSQGVGDKSLTLSAGTIGKTTSVTLSAQAPGLGTFTASQTINPTLVNLIWEADSSVPPFYEGKSLLSWGGTYKIVALPQIYENGAAVSPSRLVYTWSKNYSVDPDQSGYGKNVYKDDGSINYTRGGDTISLTVATADGKISAADSIAVSPITSSFLIYLESPIYGVMYNRSLSQTELSGDSITLHAEPYFFSDISSAIGALAWNMNGSPVASFAGNPSLTLVRQDKTAGTSVVDASIQSPTELLQGATGSVTINIDAEK